jgi:hypothetical protein
MVTKALLVAGFGGCKTLSEEGPEVNLQNQAIAQACAFCSPFSYYAQKPCYGLTVATPSDSVVCKVESWPSHLRSWPEVPSARYRPARFRV